MFTYDGKVIDTSDVDTTDDMVIMEEAPDLEDTIDLSNVIMEDSNE